MSILIITIICGIVGAMMASKIYSDKMERPISFLKPSSNRIVYCIVGFLIGAPIGYIMSIILKV